MTVVKMKYAINITNKLNPNTKSQVVAHIVAFGDATNICKSLNESLLVIDSPMKYSIEELQKFTQTGKDIL